MREFQRTRKSMRRCRIIVVLAGVLLLICACGSEHNSEVEGETWENYTDYFSAEMIHTIYVEMAQEEWQAAVRNPEGKVYYEADLTIDGQTVENVGIRTRGNSSLRAARRRKSDRFPLRIKFDKYVEGQKFLGLDELVLNNGNDDASFLREYLGYEAFRQIGADVPYVSFFNLYINGELKGLYVGVEAVDNSFLDRVFGNHKGNLYKALEGADLRQSMNLDLLEQKKGKTEDKEDVQRLLKLLAETPAGKKGGLETILDVDSVLKYFAASAVIHNWDDYAGQFAHNYYFYWNDGKFHMLPWDMNEGFLQTQAYYRESDGARQDISTPVTGNAALSARPLVEKLLAVPEYDRKYLEYCDILREWLEKNAAGEMIRLKNLIQESVEKDPTKFFTTEAYEKQFAEDNRYGLVGFVRERAEYLKEALKVLQDPDLIENSGKPDM